MVANLLSIPPKVTSVTSTNFLTLYNQVLSSGFVEVPPSLETVNLSPGR